LENKYKYSVLMSLYKKEHPEYLRESLDSMINQTIMPDEIVLVKDGPLTNELELVINEYIKEYSNLMTIVENKTNLGLGLALQKGVVASRNEIIIRMDTDDYSVNDRCEKQLEYFNEHPEVDILGGQMTEFIDDFHNIVGKRCVPLTNEAIKNDLRKRCSLNHITVAFKKSSVIKAGNYQDWHFNEDYYLWIRMLINGAVFANLDVTLSSARVGKDMYKRRGGWKYFKSEVNLQKYMLINKVISPFTYIVNCGKRMIVQVLLPNSLRSWVYQTFARE